MGCVFPIARAGQGNEGVVLGIKLVGMESIKEAMERSRVDAQNIQQQLLQYHYQSQCV